MIDGLKPYADRRDSGLPWLGKIPAHWEVRRNGRLFVQRNETGFPDLPILEVSLKTGVRVRDFEGTNRKQVMSDREKYKRARQGDIAYNMMRLWQGAVGTSPVDGLVSPAYVVAKPLPQTDSRYYQFLFRTGAYMDEVNKFSRGIVSDRNRLYWEDFKKMPSPFPPPEEQAAIVRFLDHADRRIRRYIRAKRQLIALLNEHKQAIIHRAVTRGLDPHVKLKPSGVEWLGDVPEHWGVVALKWLCNVLRDGTHLPPPRVASGIPLLSVRNIIGGKFQLREDDSMISLANYEALCRSFTPNENDILFAIVGATLGKVAVVPDMPRFQIQRSLAILRARRDRLHYQFLAYFMRGPGFQKALWTTVAFSAQPGIYLNTLGDFRVLMPPLSEQEDIFAHIESQSTSLDSSVAKATKQIDLLHAYRTRLIVDVVTGKLDVREAAAELPDELNAVEPDAEELLDSDETTDDAELDTEPEEIEA